MYTLEWGYAQNGLSESKKFRTLSNLQSYADHLTDYGYWSVVIDDVYDATGDYIPEIVEQLVEMIEKDEKEEY